MTQNKFRDILKNCTIYRESFLIQVTYIGENCSVHEVLKFVLFPNHYFILLQK